MKKFLLGSIAFLIFAIAVSILQSSCEKNAQANNNSNNSDGQLNKIAYCKSALGVLPKYRYEIWTANLDGTGQSKINITLPDGYESTDDYGGPCLSPDGKKIFFVLVHGNDYPIYSCNLDGSNLTQVIDGSNYGQIHLGGVY